MKRSRTGIARIALIALLALFCTTRSTIAQQPKGDVREFTIRPIAPPTPALKYTLLFVPADRTTGNAAVAYMQAAMLIKPETDQLQDKCMDAQNAGDEATFRTLAAEMIPMTDGVVDVLDVAGRRDSCLWDPPLRERGVAALLPHLNKMRLIANILHVRAIAQARDGKPDDAIATIRLGYELAEKVGTEPVLISGMVALGIQRQMHNALNELMSRPDCPNLYWALASLPRSLVGLRESMAGEGVFLYGSIPALDRARKGDDLSAEEWRAIVRQLALLDAQAEAGATTEPAPHAAATLMLAQMSPAAQAYYAKLLNRPADDVAKLDAIKVNGVYLFAQYQEAVDDMFKLLTLSYPQMIEQMENLEKRLAERHKEMPNPFLGLVPSISRAAKSFERADRELAALTAVEAIRSYAAANGKLPDRLDDVTDTPAPRNPMTGEAFEYAIEKDAAVLRDVQSKWLLEYTVRLKG